MELRVCKSCLIEKPITAFPIRKSPNGVAYRKHTCSACKSRKYRQNPEKRALCKDHQKKAKQKYNDNKPAMKFALLEHINQTQCQKCGIDDPQMLCFHHIDPSQKEFEIKWGMTHSHSLDSLKKEAEKCMILCGNCHVLHHYKGVSAWAKKVASIKRQLVNSLNTDGCIQCGFTSLPALAFHHRHDKQFEISYGMNNGYDLELLMAEAQKCDVLCTNCHLKIHAKTT